MLAIHPSLICNNHLHSSQSPCNSEIKLTASMADAIDFSKTHRIVLLIDLNPLLLHSRNPNPNPNYITSIIATSRILLSFPSLSSSLFSYKLFFSSLSPLLSASTLHRILPDHPSASLSFNSPSQTLDSIHETLNSISFTELTCSDSKCSHIVSSLLQLAHDYDWESGIENISGTPYHDVMDIRSNLVILFSPVCRSLKSLAEFMCVDVNDDCLRELDGYRAKFRDCFGVVNDVFNGKDIHFCWVDFHDNVEELKVNEFEQQSVLIADEIRKFGWGFCPAESVILGSALVSFGLIYPNIVVSSKLLNSCRLDKIRGQLNLEILDVCGKPLECKCCDLELLPLKVSYTDRSKDITRTCEVESSKGQGVKFTDSSLGSLNDGIVKLHVTAVQRFSKCETFEESSSELLLVQSAESGKKGKDGLDSLFADRVLELLAGEKSELYEKTTVPTWQIFLSFLYREGFWAMLSLSNSNGDSYTGFLKPLTIHSAVLLVQDNYFSQNSVGTNLVMKENVSQGDTDSQKGTTPLGKYSRLGDGKRRKLKKHTHQDLTWSSFCKAAYEFLDVELAEVYFANGCKKSKKLKFLKCWISQVKSRRLSQKNMPHESRQTGQDVNRQKEADANKNLAANYQDSNEHLSMSICSDQSGMQDAAALVSCSETSEAFFNDLPMKIQQGLESYGVDLKILAERLVTSSIYWLRLKHETMETLDEYCAMQVAQIIKLLLRDPKELKELKNNNPGSTSEHLVREYELQILLRLEILQSEYAGSIKEFVKMKLVKQICSLLEIIQYLVEGGFHGDLSLYDYVERTIKTRYSQNLGDIVDEIYDQMDLLPFGEENEDQAHMFNSEDSNQSWREKPDIATTTSTLIKDLFSVEDESCVPLQNIDTSYQGHTKDDDDDVRRLNEARERRERARRFVSFTSRMPDLQRVWAPKQSKVMQVKPKESKRKKQRRHSYSVVSETPLTGNKSNRQNKVDRGKASSSVSKALFQDDS